MDVVADYANLRGIGREEALNEPLPWMLFCLHRRDVERARDLRDQALSSNLASASAFIGGEGTRALQDFLAEQEQLVRHDPFAPVDPSQPTRQEIETFDKMHARARAAALRHNSPS